VEIRMNHSSPNAGDSSDSVIRNNRIRQSICRWCYDKLSLEELCRLAVTLGYRGIDLVGPDGFPTLKKYNLVGTMTPTHTIEKGLNHKENWEPCLASIRAGISATSEAGFPNVICFSGNRAGMDDQEGLANCAAAIRQVIGLVEKSRVTLCMELLNSKVDHPDYMCDHSAWGVQLAKAVGSEHFKLLYDIYHMQIMEGNIIATIKANHTFFGHYHTAGVPGRHEIDETQELHYPPIVKAIVDTGYKGWLAQEFVPRGDVSAALSHAGKLCDV
jgi:hydroxypyruvate isomerase